MIEIYGYNKCSRCKNFIEYVEQEGFEYKFYNDVYETDIVLMNRGWTYAPAIRYDGEWFTPETFRTTYE